MKSKMLIAVALTLVVATAQETIETRWWTIFDDSTLVGIVDHGVANNKNLQASKKRTEQSGEQAKLTRSLLFPSLYANGRWNGADMKPDPDMRQTASVSLDARYNLSSLGEEMQQYKATKKNYEAMLQDYREAELNSTVQISKLYFDAVFAKGQIAILEKQQETAEQLLAVTQRRYNEGLTSGLALLQQKQQLASVEASIPPAKLQYNNSVEFLAAVTFLPIDTLYTLIPDTLPYLEENLKRNDFTVEHRPDLAAASLREEAAKASFNKAKLTLVPDVSLTASRGWDITDPSMSGPQGSTDGEWQYMWNVGAQVSMPIFTGGAVISGYREGRSGYEAAVALREQAQSDAQAELTNALTGEESYRAQVQAYAAQLDASQAVYDESLRQYRNGLVEYIEVLASINTLQRTEITLLQSTRNLLQARLNIVQAIGGSLPDSMK